MGKLQERAIDDKFLERLGFAVSALEYFLALEESEFPSDVGYSGLWPSMVAAALHIQRANYVELRDIGERFLDRYLDGLIGYVPKRNTPVILPPPVESAVCNELKHVWAVDEPVTLAIAE